MSEFLVASLLLTAAIAPSQITPGLEERTGRLIAASRLAVDLLPVAGNGLA